jgi:hypothetical protein
LLDQLTFEQMKPHVGSTFQAEAGDGRTLDLKLTDARKVMESEAARLKRNPFSLYFDGPREPFLPQAIYRLRHEAFGEPLDIFLVPVAGNAAGYTYEAVFT